MRRAASKQGNHEVFFHMSNHYRRLYNAKCNIDTSAPSGYRKQQTLPIDLCNEALIDLITNDTKQSPNSYTGHICIEKGKQHMKSRTATYRPPTRNFCKRATNKVPPIDIIDRHAQNFVSPNRTFQPRILKTEAQSRVRDMRVYHPPCRRKKPAEVKSQEEKKWEEEVVSVQLSDLCSAQKLISSKESSRDSAYNGGISSGANTPEQASPVSDRYQLDASPSKPDSTPVGCQASHICSKPQKTIISQQNSNIRNDAAYVHFVHNITEDVLARGIYSDRGLRQLFERHMSNNEGQLSMDRMRQEIANLCRQIGILEQDNYKDDNRGDVSTISQS